MARYAQFGFLMAGLVDSSGNALGLGTVTFYAPGTTTFKNVYDAFDGTGGAAANPFPLNADGTAQVYGFGSYDILVKDVEGVEVHTWEDVLVGANASAQRDKVVATSAGQTAFTLPFAASGSGTNILVVQNGVLVASDNYTISGLTCTFTAAQAAFVQVGDVVEFIEV